MASKRPSKNRRRELKRAGKTLLALASEPQRPSRFQIAKAKKRQSK